MNLFYKILRLLLLLNIFLHAQSIRDNHEIDKGIMDISTSFEYQCSPNNFSLLDDLIEECHDSYYLYGAHKLIDFRIMKSIGIGQENDIYEMEEKYKNLSNQAQVYGISNKYLYYKFLNFVIRDYIEGYNTIKDDLYSLVNSHIIADDPIKKYVIALYMWQLSAGKEEHLLYQNIIDELIESNNEIKNTSAYAEYCYKKSMELIDSQDYNNALAYILQTKSLFKKKDLQNADWNTRFDFIIEYCQVMINEPNANDIMSLKRQFLKILNTDFGILLLDANTALYISNMNDAFSYFELFDDANEILFKSTRL